MLLNFNQFDRYINDIKVFEDERAQWFNYGVDILDDSIVSIIEQDLIEIIINCAPKEKQHIVSWWLWENHFGENGYQYHYNGKTYSLNTTEDLWSFIQD